MEADFGSSISEQLVDLDRVPSELGDDRAHGKSCAQGCGVLELNGGDPGVGSWAQLHMHPLQTVLLLRWSP